MAGRANDPLWKARLVNARFDEAGLLISTRRIRKGEEILVDYCTKRLYLRNEGMDVRALRCHIVVELRDH